MIERLSILDCEQPYFCITLVPANCLPAGRSVSNFASKCFPLLPGCHSFWTSNQQKRTPFPMLIRRTGGCDRITARQKKTLPKFKTLAKFDKLRNKNYFFVSPFLYV